MTNQPLREGFHEGFGKGSANPQIEFSPHLHLTSPTHSPSPAPHLHLTSPLTQDAAGVLKSKTELFISPKPTRGLGQKISSKLMGGDAA